MSPVYDPAKVRTGKRGEIIGVSQGTGGGGGSSDHATLTNRSVSTAKHTLSATDKITGRKSAGAGDWEEIDCTAAGRALLDDASAADQRTTLGLGTAATHAHGDYQPADSDLSDIAGIARVRGDLMVTDSTPKWTRLPLGTSGYPLVAGATDPAYAKIAQSVSHESPDTDAAAGSLHHTLGTGANQASEGPRAPGIWGAPIPSAWYLSGAQVAFSTAIAAGAMAANTWRVWPVLHVGNRVIEGIYVDCTTSGAGTSVLVAVWEDDGSGYPGALVGSQAIATTSTGVRKVTGLSWALDADKRYWIGCNCNSNTPQLRKLITTNCMPLSWAEGATTGGNSYYLAEAYADPPADPFTAGGTISTTGTLPAVFYRFST